LTKSVDFELFVVYGPVILIAEDDLVAAEMWSHVDQRNKTGGRQLQHAPLFFKLLEERAC
jgi:hypothetical protein